MLPAIGQGALALEARNDDERLGRLCRGLADAEAEATVAAERALLAGLEAGCRPPWLATPRSGARGASCGPWWGAPTAARSCASQLEGDMSDAASHGG